MSDSKVIKIRLSLKGRPMRTFTFNKTSISVGRDPNSDIFLDNPGVSRDHLKIEQTPGGYYAVEDLGSANGTFVNDNQVQREYLMNNDVVRVGKFSLWISYQEDKRGDAASGTPVSANTYEGTTVLSVSELDEMMTKVAETDAEPPQLQVIQGSNQEEKPSAAVRSELMLPTTLMAFAAGAIVGAAVMWFVVS
ncbi:MAG: FHA domain-containing protein [Candidatus Eisenbacteria bacterium]|uniref:FHA domain-containing protein n=1 Tax=Eiseniibacteriota bacterium TaxID=2212470 RepID=A0A7Y2E892_UNCEI|nr:FHA domain-containing protein [Candidatus Eisenbacteria bacterium]